MKTAVFRVGSWGRGAVALTVAVVDMAVVVLLGDALLPARPVTPGV